MALCVLPPRPTKAALLGAHSILERACDAAESFIDAFATVRKARHATGTATDHEQDLMRAALIFAAAGLDSSVKQLVRDTLQTVISNDRGAHRQFTDYVQSKDQLLRVAAYFAIPAAEISNDLTMLDVVFQTRNQIAHEMDILLGQQNRGRRQRKAALMKDYASFVLTIALPSTLLSKRGCDALVVNAPTWVLSSDA